MIAWTQRQGALLRRLTAGERVNDADLDWLRSPSTNTAKRRG
jgi:hypothetical protein